MKYMRKTPVEAIQWTGNNLRETSEFISDATKSYSIDDFGSLDITYSFQMGRISRVVIPLFGWIVREGNAFEFYKDATFRKTFDEVPDDSKGIDWDGMTDTINKAFEGFDDIFKGFHGVSHKDIVDALNKKARSANISNGAQRLSDFLRRGCISRAEAEKHLLGGVTFDSVLDEMKELHAKKNKDYGDAAHVNFFKYGPVASLSRLSEKMQRAEHILLSGKCEVKDEPLTETLIDIAITSAMLYMELKNKE